MCLSYLNRLYKKNFILNVLALHDKFKHTIYLLEISFAHSLFIKYTHINWEAQKCRAYASVSPSGNGTKRSALSVDHSQCDGSNYIWHERTFSGFTKPSSYSSTSYSKLVRVLHTTEAEKQQCPKTYRNMAHTANKWDYTISDEKSKTCLKRIQGSDFHVVDHMEHKRKVHKQCRAKCLSINIFFKISTKQRLKYISDTLSIEFAVHFQYN